MAAGALLFTLAFTLAVAGIASVDDPAPEGESQPPPASESTTAPPPAPIINLVFTWDFDIISTAVRRSRQETFGGIAGGIRRNVLDPPKGSSLNFLTQTPPSVTYANTAVVGLWGYSRAVASAAFALVILAVGYGLMTGGATSDVGAIPSLRSALLGLLLANTSLWWIGLSVDLGNALTSGIGAVTLPSSPGALYTTLPFEWTAQSRKPSKERQSSPANNVARSILEFRCQSGAKTQRLALSRLEP